MLNKTEISAVGADFHYAALGFHHRLYIKHGCGFQAWNVEAVFSNGQGGCGILLSVNKFMISYVEYNVMFIL